MLRLDAIDHAGHLIQLLGADVGTVGEAEVDEAVLALEVLLGEILALVRLEVEGPADERLAHALVRLCDALARHAGFFVTEVDCQAHAGDEEEEAGGPGEGLRGGVSG